MTSVSLCCSRLSERMLDSKMRVSIPQKLTQFFVLTMKFSLSDMLGKIKLPKWLNSSKPTNPDIFKLTGGDLLHPNLCISHNHCQKKILKKSQQNFGLQVWIFVFCSVLSYSFCFVVSSYSTYRTLTFKGLNEYHKLNISNLWHAVQLLDKALCKLGSCQQEVVGPHPSSLEVQASWWNLLKLCWAATSLFWIA